MSLSPGQLFLPTEYISGIQKFLVWEAIDGCLYAIGFLLTVFTVLLLCQQGIKNSPFRWFLVAATMMMCLSSTITIISDTVFYTVQLQALANFAYDAVPTMTRWEIVAIVFTRMSYVLGDLIVVWRAWILFQSEFAPRCILCFCVLQSFGSSIYDSVIAIQGEVDYIMSTSINSSRVILPLSMLVTNITATLLVAYKTWHYRRFIKTHLGNIKRSSQVEQVLILMIESGAIYCILWVLVIPVAFSKKYALTVDDYLGVVTPHLETIYPTTIILLAQLKKTEFNSTLQWLSSQEQSNKSQHQSNAERNNDGIELINQPEGNSFGLGDGIIEVERDAVVA